MPLARNGSNLLTRAAYPAMTTQRHFYLVYGQSNSSGVVPTSTNLPTVAAAHYGYAGTSWGRNSRQTEDTSVVWADLTFVPPTPSRDFSTMAASNNNYGLYAHDRFVIPHRVNDVLQARQLSVNGQRYNCQFIVLGHTGYTYDQLKKGDGSSTFQSYLNLLSAANRLYADTPTGVFKGVIWVHGEAVFSTSGSGYEASLVEIQGHLETDLKAISGQTESVPLFITQQSNFANNAGSAGIIYYPLLDQYNAHVNNPGKIILCGPMYNGANFSSSNLHYEGVEAQKWSNSIGNAIAKTNIDNTIWQPLRPASISRSGANVDIVFHVPSGSLTLDTTYLANAGDGFYGFDFRQTGGTTTLSSVSLLNSTTLRLTLSGAPDGASPKIRGGRNVTAGAAVQGARTNLRDTSNSEARFCNWCCHFDIDVP